MIAEATHPWLTARPPPLRPPKRTELLLARALGTLKPLLSRGYSPGGSRGEARRLSRELGSWLSPPGHGRRSPGAAPAAPWREERGRLPPAPAGRSGQGQRAGRGQGVGGSQAAGSRSTASVPSPHAARTPASPLRAVLAAAGSSTKCPPRRLRRSLPLAAMCISGWLVNSHRSNG